MSESQMTLAQKIQKVRDALPIGTEGFILDSYLNEAMGEIGGTAHMQAAQDVTMRAVCEMIAADRVARLLCSGGTAEQAKQITVGDVAAEIGLLDIYWSKETTNEQKLTDIDRQMSRMAWMALQLKRMRDDIQPPKEGDSQEADEDVA